MSAGARERLPDAVAGEAPTELEAASPQVAAIGSLRQAVLDHLLDSEESGPQTVAQIIAALSAGTSRNTAESAIRRNFESGLIERVAPGKYVLAKPKPPDPPKPPSPEPVRRDGAIDERQWLSWIEEWKAIGEWKGLGNPPDQSGHLVPVDAISKYNERTRKREQRRTEAAEAAAKRVAADAELRGKLIAGCYGNVMLGPGINDVTVVKAMLQDGVPLEHILIGLKRTVDRRHDPRAAPIGSWRDERFLKAVARCALLEGLAPRLIESWSKAGMPASRKPADASLAPAAAQVPPEPQTAPAASPDTPISNNEIGQTDLLAKIGGQGDGAKSPPNVTAAASAAPPQADDGRPVGVGREEVLAAFARNRTPPPPAMPQPRPMTSTTPSSGRQAQSLSPEAWEELVAGFAAGNVNWNVRRLGAPPGHQDCKAPRDILRRYGL